MPSQWIEASQSLHTAVLTARRNNVVWLRGPGDGSPWCTCNPMRRIPGCGPCGWRCGSAGSAAGGSGRPAKQLPGAPQQDLCDRAKRQAVHQRPASWQLMSCDAAAVRGGRRAGTLGAAAQLCSAAVICVHDEMMTNMGCRWAWDHRLVGTALWHAARALQAGRSHWMCRPAGSLKDERRGCSKILTALEAWRWV